MKTVNDILKTNGSPMWFIAPDSYVNNAIRLMDEKQVEAMPVLEAGNLVGVISEKVCLIKGILNRKSPEKTQVWEIMERNIVSTTPGQTVEDCLDIMTENHIQYLPVIADENFVGFVSICDLLKAMITDQKDYINRLENYVMGIGFL